MNYFESYMDAPLIVMLHGFPNNYLVFEKQIEDFKKDHHILAINLPGCNDDLNPTSNDYELNTLVSNIENLILEKINNKENKKIILVGHDLGCFVLDLVAGRLNKKVSLQVHISGMGLSQYVARRFSLQQWIRSHYIVLLHIPGCIRLAQVHLSELIKKIVYELSGIEKQSSLYNEAPNGFKGIGLYLSLAKNCRKLLLKKIGNQKSAIPTLFIFGKNEKFLNLTTEKEINNFYVDGKNKIIEGGHWALKDKSIEVNTAIREFMVVKNEAV